MICTAIRPSSKNSKVILHCNKAKLKNFKGLALMRCKSPFKIFELGLIAVQNDFSNFRAWSYCGANHFFKFSILALLRCISVKISKNENGKKRLSVVISHLTVIPGWKIWKNTCDSVKTELRYYILNLGFLI